MFGHVLLAPSNQAGMLAEYAVLPTEPPRRVAEAPVREDGVGWHA